MIKFGHLNKYLNNVIIYESSQENELFNFLKQVFPNDKLRWDKSHWKWEFLNNPYSVASPVPFFMYKSNNKILGSIGFIPIDIKVGTEEIRASWGVDLIVVPEVRGLGIGVLLIYQGINSFKSCMALGISDEAFNIYKNLGWICVEHIPNYTLVLNPWGKFNKRNPTLRKFILFLLWSLHNILLKSIYFSDKVGSMVVFEKISTFDEQIDIFFERISGKYKIIAKRTQKFLNWRFFQRPDAQYDIFIIKKSGNFEGYFILRIIEEYNEKKGIIVDFLIDPDNIDIFAALLDYAIAYFIDKKVDIISCVCSDSRFEKFFKRRGLLKKYYAGCRLATNISFEPSFLKNISNWFLTLGDSDQDC